MQATLPGGEMLHEFDDMTDARGSVEVEGGRAVNVFATPSLVAPAACASPP